MLYFNLQISRHTIHFHWSDIIDRYITLLDRVSISLIANYRYTLSSVRLLIADGTFPFRISIAISSLSAQKRGFSYNAHTDAFRASPCHRHCRSPRCIEEGTGLRDRSTRIASTRDFPAAFGISFKSGRDYATSAQFYF